MKLSTTDSFIRVDKKCTETYNFGCYTRVKFLLRAHNVVVYSPRNYYSNFKFLI